MIARMIEDRSGRYGRFSVHNTAVRPGTSSQVGETFIEWGFDEFEDTDVALSADGQIAAYSFTNNETDQKGYVRIYRYNSQEAKWLELGTQIDGESSRDHSGNSIDLSADGLTIIIGAALNDGNGEDAGHARVFRYDEGKAAWSQLGQDLDGTNAGDRFGSSVSLSADGLTALIGAPGSDVGGEDAGQARVFQFQSSTDTWVPSGQSLNGAVASVAIGAAVDLSADGRTAIASSSRRGVYATSAIVYPLVFRFKDDSQQWERFDKEAGEVPDSLGMGVASFSADSLTAVIGATNSNSARAYQFDTTSKAWNQVQGTIEGRSFDEAFGISVGVSADGNLVVASTTDSFNSIGGVEARAFRVKGPEVMDFQVISGRTRVTDIDTSDDARNEFSGIIFSITGIDAEKFKINQQGLLEFKTTPNLQQPIDQDGDNVYEITVEVTDSTLAFDQQALRVTVVTDQPALTEIPDIEILRNQTTVTSAALIDAVGPNDRWNFSVSSSNLQLIDQSGLTLRGTGLSRFLSIVPKRGAVGSSQITITSGDDNYTTSRTFTVNVRNQAPQIRFSGGVATGSWTQLKNQLNDPALLREEASVDISVDGRTAVVGTPDASRPGYLSGHTRVYRFDSVDQSWSQLGQALNGVGLEDRSGASVSLSGDGSIVAIGTKANEAGNDYVRVFAFDQASETWRQMGDPLTGQSVALTADGHTALTASFNRAIVYQFDEAAEKWNIQASIDGKVSSVDISNDGQTLIVGSPDSGAEGKARIFQLNPASNSWEQQGADLVGEAAGDHFGTAVTLSADGKTALVGAPNNKGAGFNAGHARAFRYDVGSATWQQLGQDITPPEDTALLGHSVSLSADGSIAAVTAKTYRYVTLHWFDEAAGQWKLLPASASFGIRGAAGALSADGLTLFTSLPHRFGNGPRGFSRAYQYTHDQTYQISEGGDLRVANINSSDDINAEGNGSIYSLAGADASKFQIDAAGMLNFRAAPDFENPTDADSDNVYELTVVVTDAENASAEAAISVAVIDVEERVDIAVTIEALQAPLVAGGPALPTFLMVAKNNGPADATNIVLESSVQPANINIVGATATAGTFANHAWTLDLANGASASLLIEMQADSSASSGASALPFQCAFESCDQEEIGGGNNSSEVMLPLVGAANLAFQTSILELNQSNDQASAAVEVINNGETTVPAARLYITNLPDGIAFANATGTTARGSYILLKKPLAAGSMVSAEVQFSGQNLDSAFTPTVELELLSGNEPSDSGQVQSKILASGEPLLQMGAVPGAVYEVYYTSDLAKPWKKAAGQVTVNTNQLFWIDRGDPQTDVHPKETERRFYRFVLISNPEDMP